MNPSEPLIPHLGQYGQTWKGFLVGLGLFLASFPLLSWNETSTIVVSSQVADDFLDRPVSVVTDRVQPVNEGRLVHLTGELTPIGNIVDPDLQISFAVLKLQRQVETYQWIESRPAATASTAESPPPVYAKAWLAELVDSTAFAEPKAHANPQRKRLTDWESQPAKAKLGDFDLPADLLDRFNQFTALTLTESDRKSLPEELRRATRVFNGLLYFSKDPEHPQVGDARVRYIAVKPSEVSVIARQAGSTFAPFVKRSGFPLYKIEAGKRYAEEMDTAPVAWISLSTVMTWLFRVLGLLLQICGLLIMLEKGMPSLERIAWLRPLLAQGPLVFAAVVAATLTLLTIGFSWLSYSWMLGSFLMTLAALIAFLSLRLSQRLGDHSPPVRESTAA